MIFAVRRAARRKPKDGLVSRCHRHEYPARGKRKGRHGIHQGRSRRREFERRTVTLFVQEPESGRIWGQRCSAPHVNVHCRDYALNPKSREKFRYVLRDLNAILRQRTMRKVKPGAAKVALERVAPKHAEQPVERTARRVDAVRVAIGTKKRNGL